MNATALDVGDAANAGRLRPRGAGGCFVVAIAIAACASGPAFVTPELPQSGAFAVYLYRASALGGAAIEQDVTFDGRRVARLVNGSYLRVELPATEQFVDVRARDCSRLKQPLLLRPGRTAYVQLALTSKTVEFGGRHYFDYGCELVQRSESEALPDHRLAACQLSRGRNDHPIRDT